MKVRRTKENMYAVIGLGRFGFALAQRLAESGAELIVVDKEESVINDATAFTDNAFLVNELTRENLSNIGIQNCDTVIVGIGGKIDVSILTTLTVIQLGVPRVIAKANSVEQGCVLEKLGAEVIYPERDMGVRLANRLLAPRVMEYIALSDDISITEIRLPESVKGVTVQALNLRQRYGFGIHEKWIFPKTKIPCKHLLPAWDNFCCFVRHLTDMCAGTFRNSSPDRAVPRRR